MTEVHAEKLLSILRKRIVEGDEICINTKTSGKIEGVFEEVDGEWIVINQGEHGENIVDIGDVVSINICNSRKKISNVDNLKLENEKKASDNKDGKEIQSPISVGERKEPLYHDPKQDEKLRMIFCGAPQLSAPAPIFDERLKNNKELWLKIDPWRNKYNNAIKIREYNRLLPLIDEITSEADKYVKFEDKRISGYLYYLAGIFSIHGGHVNGNARKYLEYALKYDYIDASLAYGSLLISDGDYDNAPIHLAKAVMLKDGDNCEEIIKTIGQCIMKRTKNDCLPIGEILHAQKLSEEYKRISRELIEYMLQDDPDAIEAVKLGDINQLRKTKIGNDLFPWESHEGNRDFSGIEEISLKIPQNKNDRRGKITAVWPERNMGFVTENQTGQSWFFNILDNTSDKSLRDGLMQGRINQEVFFEGDLNSGNGKYPTAINIISLEEADSSINSTKEKAPLSRRLEGLPQNSSYYAKAKKAEQYDQLNEAERNYKNEIEINGSSSKYYKSAIKDLASLYNRTDGLKAIAVLDKYSDAFNNAEESRSILHMKAQFYSKASEYRKAAELFKSLAKNLPPYDNKRCAYLQQEAYCYYALGEYDKAIKKFNALYKAFPTNESIANFIIKIEEAQCQGIEIPLEDIKQIAGELPPLSKMRIEKCKLDGIEAQAKEKYDFSDADLDRISGLIADVRQKRPLERSKFRLTLAWLQKELSKPFDELYNTMCRYFHEQAVGSAYDSSIPAEVVRCYALEALRLAVPQEHRNTGVGGTGRWIITTDDEIINETWSLFVANYLCNPKKPNELFVGKKEVWLSRVLDELKKEEENWEIFLSDIKFIHSRVKHVFSVLVASLERIGVHINNLISDIDNSYYQRESKLYILFDNLSNMTCDKFNQIREEFLSHAKEYRPDLDKKRTSTLIKVLEDCATYTSQRCFWNKERIYLRLRDDLEHLIEDCEEKPTTLTIEKMYPALKNIHTLLESDFSLLSTQEPEFELKNVLDTNMYSLDRDNMLSLKLLLSSKNESAPPVESLSVFPAKKDVKFEGGQFPETMGAGDREFEFRFCPTKKQVDDKAFSLDLKIEYRLRNGESRIVGPYSISVQIGEEMTSEIANVYARYAGGAEVDDEKMFFGRETLVSEICSHLSEHSGQCFVLYGQKRSGKTSVLRHVGKNLPKNCFFTESSALNFNYSREKILTSFVSDIYDLIVYKLEDYDISIDDTFPTYEEAGKEPQRTLRRISKFLSKRGFQWVIAIDEFTAIYTDDKEEVAAFMHAWKSFLEEKLFNALIIGQDTMPRFKNEYPNDFCVTHDRRITFLSKESTFRMAVEPILFNGNSRYRGNALDKIFSLTSGSPYFLQKICSSIVDYINRQRTPFITGADVENVAEIMTRGEKRLESEVFDALVTAGDEKNAIVQRDILWKVLTIIAQHSRLSGWCSRNELETIDGAKLAIKDLLDRDTLVIDEDKVKIKVELFERWLRINMGDQNE